MTTIMTGQAIANIIAANFPEAIIDVEDRAVVIKSDLLIKIADYLKNSQGQIFSYLSDITSVDYFDYFEVVYRLTSIEHNNSLALKIRCYGRDNLQVPSVTGIWQGADFMEREIFDLMGISFTGHPNLKHIFLWEGFKGYPLRKDYL